MTKVCDSCKFLAKELPGSDALQVGSASSSCSENRKIGLPRDSVVAFVMPRCRFFRNPLKARNAKNCEHGGALLSKKRQAVVVPKALTQKNPIRDKNFAVTFSAGPVFDIHGIFARYGSKLRKLQPIICESLKDEISDNELDKALASFSLVCAERGFKEGDEVLSKSIDEFVRRISKEGKTGPLMQLINAVGPRNTPLVIRYMLAKRRSSI